MTTLRNAATKPGPIRWKSAPAFGRRRLPPPQTLPIALILAFGLFSAPAAHAQSTKVLIDPNTMLVDNKLGPRHLFTFTPQFAWTFPGPCCQTNWQIQVDSDPNFNGHIVNNVNEIWFWDSGSGTKAGLESKTKVNYGVVVPPGQYSRALDTRADFIYWRLRVQVNSDPNWDKDPSYFSYGSFKMNLIPMPSEGLTAAADLNAGTVASLVFPVINPSPKEFFVATTGNDANAGTLAAPFRTINHGVNVLGPGDTLTIRGGTYLENVHIAPTPTTGAKSGTPGNPITVRNRAGELVTVKGGNVGSIPSTIFFEGSPVLISNWIVDGLRIGGTGIAVGIYITNADFITVKNLSFESTFPASASGIRYASGGTGSRVLNSRFDTDMFDQIDISSARAVEIRGNDFSNFVSHLAVDFHGNGSQGGIVEGNVFHDAVSERGAVTAYLGADGTVIRNNVFYNIQERPGGYSAGVTLLRQEGITVENNTFVKTVRALAPNEFSRFALIRNNIFYKNTTGIDFTPLQSAQPGSTTVGMLLSHNLFFGNGKNMDFFYPQDATLINSIANCPLDPNATANMTCDPLFVDPNKNDFHLQAASPARDKGDPNEPVPVGGGSVVDIGALEFGAAAAPPYDYQPVFTVGDPTPKFSWTMVDRDNDLHNIFGDPTNIDTQAAFQLQVDTKSTFDSVNGSRPILDTGTILSMTPEYTIPNLNALTAGDYYMRVRLRDQNQFFLACWSNPNFRVRIGSEPQAPILTQESPAPGAVAVSPTATVSTHVVDFGAGVNSGTITMHIGINDPSAPTLVTPIITQSGPTAADFLVAFTPSPGQFSDNDVITVRITADDLFVPPNHLDTAATGNYSFTIADTVAPAKPLNLRFVP